MAPLRISFGVAAIAPGLSPEDLLAAADKAMYRAKRSEKAQAGPAAAVEGKIA
jgi:PleD family two-component response regulator